MHKSAGYNSPKGAANNAEQNLARGQAKPALCSSHVTVTVPPAAQQINDEGHPA
ncbi:MAG: hypothetical protein Q8R10_19885 [Pseudomonas sp.]|uniref:hypothetical protein n=1 Tax=Pseudomonas sp. TaxID=306 RepID=UPI0027376E47|nr:hypothetical protein [Pseudomonas sp.]MDP3848685.1 hypothetical protein [Pseudomonas sp.]